VRKYHEGWEEEELENNTRHTSHPPRGRRAKWRVFYVEASMDNENYKKILQALGETSGVFMSQGDTKAKDIVMPTTELADIACRLCQDLFGE
jgi:hypothetical protein